MKNNEKKNTLTVIWVLLMYIVGCFTTGYYIGVGVGNLIVKVFDWFDRRKEIPAENEESEDDYLE